MFAHYLHIKCHAMLLSTKQLTKTHIVMLFYYVEILKSLHVSCLCYFTGIKHNVVLNLISMTLMHNSCKVLYYESTTCCFSKASPWSFIAGKGFSLGSSSSIGSFLPLTKLYKTAVPIIIVRVVESFV